MRESLPLTAVAVALTAVSVISMTGVAVFDVQHFEDQYNEISPAVGVQWSAGGGAGRQDTPPFPRAVRHQSRRPACKRRAADA